MSISGSPHETVFQFPSRRALKEKQDNTLTAKLQAALAREQRLIREKHELSKRQVMLAQEFEHRLVNGLQLIASLLSLQSRTAGIPLSSMLKRTVGFGNDIGPQLFSCRLPADANLPKSEDSDGDGCYRHGKAHQQGQCFCRHRCPACGPRLCVPEAVSLSGDRVTRSLAPEATL
jgi:hypothetical protein